jgi:hypothetical protein
MYKLKDLIPIRPNEFRLQDCDASKVAVFWTLNKKNDNGWTIDSYPFFYKTEWIVPAQSAPDEVKPLAYPENKPSDDGQYVIHDKNRDVWDTAIWNDEMDHVWDANVDYFIPISLDESVSDTDELGDEGKMGKVIWELGDNKNVNIISESEFLYKLNYFKEGIYISPRQLQVLMISLTNHFGYAVTRKEPEIKPCPNPECKSNQAVYVETGRPPYNYRYVNCDGCGYCGPEADTLAEAIRLHNLIAWRE